MRLTASAIATEDELRVGGIKNDRQRVPWVASRLRAILSAAARYIIRGRRVDRLEVNVSARNNLAAAFGKFELLQATFGTVDDPSMKAQEGRIEVKDLDLGRRLAYVCLAPLFVLLIPGLYGIVFWLVLLVRFSGPIRGAFHYEFTLSEADINNSAALRVPLQMLLNTIMERSLVGLALGAVEGVTALAADVGTDQQPSLSRLSHATEFQLRDVVLESATQEKGAPVRLNFNADAIFPSNGYASTATQKPELSFTVRTMLRLMGEDEEEFDPAVSESRGVISALDPELKVVPLPGWPVPTVWLPIGTGEAVCVDLGDENWLTEISGQPVAGTIKVSGVSKFGRKKTGFVFASKS